jgi:hypothetical protein
MTTLSDSLEDKVTQEIYGLFPTPVGRFTLNDWATLRNEVYSYINKVKIQDESGRESICHNVKQIGDKNKCIEETPLLTQALIQIAQKFNDSTYNYDVNFAISEAYLEIGSEGALYAPHEHSNCLFSATVLINYEEGHSPVKFRRNVTSSYYPVMQFPSKGMSPYNLTEATTPMEEGDVIIYPSMITHGFEGNAMPNRIALTVNFVPV